MLGDAFTPHRERERRARIATALRGGSMASPAWLLCPDAQLRQELTFTVASLGGGFFRAVDWSMLAEQLDHRLGLPFAAPSEESERLLAVERALVARSAPRSVLRDALAADPFGVASSLLGVVDLLRAHAWSGELPGEPEVFDTVGAVTRDHLQTLAALMGAVQRHLDAGGQLDLVGRLLRAGAALRGGRRSGLATVLVDGIDRLEPAQRSVLRGLRDTGCVVDVAPWVLGWDERAGSPGIESESTLLRALQFGARRVSDRGDTSITAVRPRDVAEEAEAFARFIAERVARGDLASQFAVSGAAAADRVRRALARWGMRSCGSARVSVCSSPLWQVVRAGVRLGWRGPNAVDLATVLAAPGAGVWGGDRDRLVSALRRGAPGTWRRVREIVEETLTEEAVAEVSEGEAAPAVDAARAQRLADARVRIDELVSLFESHGPFARHAAVDRAKMLRAVITGLLERFLDSDRFSEAVVDGRDQSAWLLAARGIEGALRVELARIEERALALPADDPSAFLSAAESLFGDVEEDLAPPRDEGVAIIDGHASVRRRPRTLLVSGFVRGAFPSVPARRLLLGPDERAWINASLPASDALPSEDDDRALEWLRTQRLFALPTERLVLSAPKRNAEGGRTDPSLTWSEFLHWMPAEDREAWLREGIPEPEAWLTRELGAPRCVRGRRNDAVKALGRGDVTEALRLAGAITAEDPEARDFFAARLRPERAYEVGDLVRGRLGEAVMGARDLESVLTCRFRFLADALLGLRGHRYARADVGPADRARAVRAALRRIDARLAEYGRASDDDVDLAVDEALGAVGGAHGVIEDLRRTTRAAVLRYLSVRSAWSLREGSDAPEEDLAEEFALSLGDRVIRARANLPRLEQADDGAGGAMLVDFTLRSLEGAARLRDLGLDVDAVLTPLAVESRRGDGSFSGYLRFSLAKPVADALAGRSAPTEDERIAPFETLATATAVRVERARRIEDHRDRVLADLTAAFDDMDRDDAVFAPHDEQEYARLHDGGARTCERCDASLACRFRMAGGA